MFYVSMECAAGRCAPAPAHGKSAVDSSGGTLTCLAWEDMSLVLNKADPSFGKTGDWLYKATGGKMSTPDGGRTWNFTTLSIPETKFP